MASKRSGLSQSREDNCSTSGDSVDDVDSDMRMVKRPRSVEPIKEDTPKIAKIGDQNGGDLTQPKSHVNAMPNKEITKASDKIETETKEPISRYFHGKKELKDYGACSPRLFSHRTNLFISPKKKQLSPQGINMINATSLGNESSSSNSINVKTNSCPDASPTDCKSEKEKKLKKLRADQIRADLEEFEKHSIEKEEAIKTMIPSTNKFISSKKKQLSTPAMPLSKSRPKSAIFESDFESDLVIYNAIYEENVGKELGFASPQPSASTNTSKDKVETRDQKLQEQVQIEDDQEVENLRTNVRKQYIELIETTNGKLFAKEQDLTFNDTIREGLKKNLKEKQIIEKEDIDTKFHQKETDLEQNVAEHEKQLTETKKKLADTKEQKRKEKEEIHKTHCDEAAALHNKLKNDQEHDKNAVAKLKEKTNKLAQDLRNLVEDPTKDKANLQAVRATLECPICMELMKPPTKIWMCSSNHIVCEPCKDKLKGRLCPTCRTEGVTLRALLAENLARTVFDEVIVERKTQFDSTNTKGAEKLPGNQNDGVHFLFDSSDDDFLDSADDSPPIGIPVNVEDDDATYFNEHFYEEDF